MPISTSAPRARAASTLLRSTGALSTAATARMEETLPWFRELSAEDRSWVGVIVQAGVRGFVDWYGGAREEGDTDQTALASAVFGAAPRALAGVITLQQTVDLVRLSIDVVESNIDNLLDPEAAADVHAAVLSYGREVAFATAMVYARAAEVRGAWDARLEALVVDAVLRAETDEGVLGRASALGWSERSWGERGSVVVVVGSMPARSETGLFEEIRRLARAASLSALCAVQGDRLVVVLGGEVDAVSAAGAVSDVFGPGPIVVGDPVEGLTTAFQSARSALSGLRAAPGWPAAPRPVTALALLPDRVLAGDGHARRYLIEEIYGPLIGARDTLAATLAAYFDAGTSLEAAGRTLFVHPNTIRYRLRQITELTGLRPSDPRDALTLQLALSLGRQSHRS